MSKLTLETINPAVVQAQYAVRGELVLRSQEMKKDLSAYPFDKVLECNIGNPQAVEQQPLSFIREVLSLVVNRSLLDKPAAAQLFAPDAIARAKEYLGAVPQGMGAYTESRAPRSVES